MGLFPWDVATVGARHVLIGWMGLQARIVDRPAWERTARFGGGQTVTR